MNKLVKALVTVVFISQLFLPNFSGKSQGIGDPVCIPGGICCEYGCVPPPPPDSFKLYMPVILGD